MNIYVGNLSVSVSEDVLSKLFSEYGTIQNAKVIKNRFSGMSKGYGFIEMPDNSEADKAIKALNGTRVGGDCIKVRPADSGAKKNKRKSNRRRPRSY